MSHSDRRRCSAERSVSRPRAISWKIALLALSFGALTCRAQPTVHAGLEVSEFFRVANGTSRGLGDMAWGNGGFFGNDLYVLEGQWPSGGRIYRITDADQDGVGEAVVLATTGQSILNPASLVFGSGGDFGTDLYVMDYPSSTSLRYVFRISNAGPTPTVPASAPRLSSIRSAFASPRTTSAFW